LICLQLWREMRFANKFWC